MYTRLFNFKIGNTERSDLEFGFTTSPNDLIDAINIGKTLSICFLLILFFYKFLLNFSENCSGNIKLYL